MSAYLMVALGGAIGAMGRFSVAKYFAQFNQGAFPIATFTVNVIGCFVMGVLFVLMTERITALEAYRPLLMVGFLGAFTTFSTFSLEIVALLNQQAWLSAISYLLLSCFCGVIGTWLGILAARLI
ncbi:camphor resistance protein CrcB [Marinomonas sp. SBI22]|uniref:fluoride efflux transporter CrcB n=1 Tax=unclassified Marinomonas TaxID=196814 RepID=UPI0005FA08BB|nr:MULTISPECIES: fluoride efflux transporter CrcB [unclassified Marinomonas]KJZ09557.1 camphor resistance protein CrcB [Marinomonas sp. S3726]KZM44419.1 camphor resistance protein CrcB [Marinomonas sp. SBI22]KZM45577.1 camphor resistance protein CrcB [Marinomonas sp. SBI8L]